MTQTSYVITSSEAKVAEAKDLADHYHFTFLPEAIALNAPHFILHLSERGLGLLSGPTTKPNIFYIDFAAKQALYRLKTTAKRHELLARALGTQAKLKPKIIDATAGLARDSFMLAGLGYELLLLERSPILYLLLSDALKRASLDEHLKLITARLNLIHAEATAWLATHAPTYQPDIIYLDPMFPKRRKAAKPKKEMVLLQSLLEGESNDVDLFKAARACALKRVIVKRPRIAPFIAEAAPTYSLTGESSRFDIYLTNPLSRVPFPRQ